MLTGFEPLQALIILIVVGAIITGIVFWFRWVVGSRDKAAKDQKRAGSSR
ncbi:hypothetical protein AB4Z18_14585 [Leifsonia sp. 2TAF2]